MAKFHRTWWLLVTTALLAACGAPGAASATVANANLSRPVISISALAKLGVPVEAIADHRVQRRVTLDGGDLLIAPPGDDSPEFSLSKAEVLVEEAMVNQEATYNPSVIVLGRVTISVPDAVGVPTYHDRLAWIGFLGGPKTASCAGSPGPGYTYAPSFDTVIMDATSGTSPVTYAARGTGPCGGQVVGPFLHSAYKVMSVPWMVVGQTKAAAPPVFRATNVNEWVVQYTVPPCGSQFDSGGFYGHSKHPALYIEVQVPMVVTQHCPSTGPVTAEWPTILGPLTHAPTGVVLGTGL